MLFWRCLLQAEQLLTLILTRMSPFLCHPLQGQDPPGQTLWQRPGGIFGNPLVLPWLWHPAQAQLEGPSVSPGALPSLAPFNLLFSQAFLDLWLSSDPARGESSLQRVTAQTLQELMEFPGRFPPELGLAAGFWGNLGFGRCLWWLCLNLGLLLCCLL